MRVEKRFSNRAQFLTSYALGSYVGTNGTGTGTTEGGGGRVFGFNNDDWFENYGPLPTDRRHVLNLSGFVDLPMRFRVAVSVSAYSRPPFSAYVGGADLNGDGTRKDLLPGTRINQFGRGLDEADLVRFVEQYNQQFADRPTPGGQPAPPLMPRTYTHVQSFHSREMRCQLVDWAENAGCEVGTLARRSPHSRPGSRCGRALWMLEDNNGGGAVSREADVV